jgi:hypothetical protein
MGLLLEIALAAMMSAHADSAIGGAAQWATRVWGLFFSKKKWLVAASGGAGVLSGSNFGLCRTVRQDRGWFEFNLFIYREGYPRPPLLLLIKWPRAWARQRPSPWKTVLPSLCELVWVVLDGGTVGLLGLGLHESAPKSNCTGCPDRISCTDKLKRGWGKQFLRNATQIMHLLVPYHSSPFSIKYKIIQHHPLLAELV